MLKLVAILMLFSGQVSAMEFSAEDAKCLTYTIYHEARGESLDGQYAVAEVVINRVKDPRWPDTVCGVVKERRQFSFFNKGYFPRMRDKKAAALAAHIALDVINTYSWGNEYIIVPIGTVFYHTTSVRPSWRKKLEFVLQAGNQLFYSKSTKGK